MNKILILLLVLLFSVSYGYGQNETDDRENTYANNDSIVVFTFRANNDMFYAPYQNNESELNRLLRITKQYNVEIKGGELPVFISGYNYSSIHPQRNLKLAKIWSNRVKSELIVRRKLREEHFITRNYAEAYYGLNRAVVVTLKFPRDILKEEAPEEVTKEAPKKEPVVIKEPVVLREVAENKETGEKTEIEITIPPKEEVVENVITIPPKEEVAENVEKAPKMPANNKTATTFSIHTNLLYWAMTTPNLGIEWIPNAEEQWSVVLNGAWTHWEWKDRTRKYRMWMASIEIRRYLSDNWFIGGEMHVGEMNIKLSDTGRQGGYFGAGAIGGYRLPVSNKFDIDFTLGLGYTRFNKDKYKMVDGLHVRTKTDIGQSLWGPTQAGVILRYKL
jgi:hypothetical protein